ncbi:MAG: glutamine amidotransferase [Patescibacteria group bacterium]|nr:glutamine amidotransferase [Patescibacteria group bacterium]
MNYKITIYHMYPDAMNLYGDYGNILTLQKRCVWHGVDCKIVNISVGDKAHFEDCDLLFIGGGQDRGQKNIADDLVMRGHKIKEEIDKGMAALTICGGFQLFGKYFKMANGSTLEGIGVFDAWTEAGNKRLVGNIIVDCRKTSSDWVLKSRFQSDETLHTTLVGFENHSGRTYLGPNGKPLGTVIKGYGNVGDGTFEGAVYKNAFGTYLHGSLLPKNPWFADHLILAALKRRYDTHIDLKPLDDSLELEAHEFAKTRAYTAKTDTIK